MTTATKPVSRKVDTMPAAYGIKAKLCVTIHPRGIISIREEGRREGSSIFLDISELYVHGIRQRVAKERREKRLARKNKKANK